MGGGGGGNTGAGGGFGPSSIYVKRGPVNRGIGVLCCNLLPILSFCLIICLDTPSPSSNQPLQSKSNPVQEKESPSRSQSSKFPAVFVQPSREVRGKYI